MSMKTTHMTNKPEEADLQPGLLTLREAIGNGSVVKIVAATLKNQTHPFTVHGATRKRLCEALMDLNGEWYRPGKWAATHESAKAVGYKTVLITIEQPLEPNDPNEFEKASKALGESVTLIANRARLSRVEKVLSAKPSLVESVIWIRVEEETPDEGVVVLLFHPDASEPVWPGVFEGCSADGYVFSHADGSMISGPVLAWAEVPGGPRL